MRYPASEKAAYITGVTIKIDGGLILPGPPEKNSDLMVPEKNPVNEEYSDGK